MSRSIRALLALPWLACTTSPGSAGGAAAFAAPAVAVEIAVQAGGVEPQSEPDTAASKPAAAEDPLLAFLDADLGEARHAQEEQDHAGARARIVEGIARALGEIGERKDAPALELLERMGEFAHNAGELRAAKLARSRVLDVQSRALPEDHPDLQAARHRLAVTLYTLGDLPGARELFEKVLEVRLRTLPDDHPELQRVRESFGATIKELGDLQGARALQEKVLEVRLRTLPDDHPDLQRARLNLAGTTKALGDVPGARALEEKVLEVRSRTLPEDHADLQKARQNLAGTMKRLGDLQGARALYEKVLEVRSRTLPDDHPDLQAARLNLAATIQALGDLSAARALEEGVLEVYSRTLPDDHPHLQLARENYAVTIRLLGDLAGARALEEKVIEVYSRTLPDDHPHLQRARMALAVTIKELGDLAGARALEEKELEVRSRTLPEDHHALQVARLNLAVTIKELGDLEDARALEEKVLEVFSRTLPEDHPDLQKARQNLAGTIKALGDLSGARALEEKVLEVRSRTLPDDHPDLQKARGNLAGTMDALGDLAGARALFEKALEVCSRSLPDDHPDLQAARGNLALTMQDLGDLAGARALFEKVLEVRSRTLPADHPHLQFARQNLAGTLYALGDSAGARALFEKVFEVRSRTLSDEHPELQVARANLALTMQDLGDLSGARALEEEVVEVRSRTLPDDHPDLQKARFSLAKTLAANGARSSRGEEKARVAEPERRRCVELTLAQCRSQTSAARSALFQSSPREAEARCDSLAYGLDWALSLAEGLDVFEPSPDLDPSCFVLSETSRGAALTSAALMRLAASSPRYAELKSELRVHGDEIAALAQKGTTSEEFHAAIRRRESLEREFISLAKEISGQTPRLDLDVEELSAKLAEKTALVVYRRYTRWRLEVAEGEPAQASTAPVWTGEETLCAFVLRRSAKPGEPNPDEELLVRVDLGPIEPIENAVHEWRKGLGFVSGRGVGVDARPIVSSLFASGNKISLLVFDPLAGSLAGAGRVVVVLDDVLHLVPFDTLPRQGSTEELLGDGMRIETRATVTELMIPQGRTLGPQRLLAVGDVAFDSASLGAPGLAPRDLPSVLRGGGLGGFSPLPATGAEVEALVESFIEQFGPGDASILRGVEATRERLIELAPGVRWLHVATHGWFASESIRSWQDPEPLDKHSGLGIRLSGEEQVKGMSPMLLCGLALAGANLPENEVGRPPGLITAGEISALDLSSCELAVLSACDTNVGERRAGQGVHSLQMALQMAGARSVITSLWKVPDEATRELMTDFYRRLWVEKKPKWQALWEAKKMLREAKDERGSPRYSTRDWAAWILTGAPE